MTGIDEAKRRAEISQAMFADRLRFFVERHAPKDPYERYEFQNDMMRLFVDAMRSQTDHMAMGVETYASYALREASLRPLTVIMEDKKP